MVNRIDRKKGTTGKSGFKYHYRSDESVRKHAERSVGSFDSIFKPGIDKFRAKPGDNNVRILPPTWEGKEHFGYQIFVHKYVGQDNGSYLCPRKMKNSKCPICEMAKEAENAKEMDEAKALRAKEDFIYWILDRQSDSEYTPIIWEQSAQADRDIVSLTRSKSKKASGTLYVDHPDEGYDLSFKRTQLGKDIKNTRYSAWAFDREATPIADDPKVADEILDFITANPLPDILKFYNYDHLEKIMSGGAEEKDEELDEDEDDGKKFKHRKRGGEEEEGEDEEIASRKAKRRRQEDESEDDEPDGDEKPARGARRQDDGEDEDNSPKARRTAKTSRPSEDDNEDDRPPRKKRRPTTDEDEDEDTETEDERPAKKVTREKLKTRRSPDPDEAANDDDEDERPRRKARAPRDEDEAEEDD